MKNSIHKILISFFALIFIASFSLNAQPVKNARERIDLLKKMKLLEILNLKEADADKFLVKYNALESEIRAKEDVLNKASRDLKDALDKNAGDKELQAKNDEVMKAFKNLQDAVTNKMTSMKDFLNPENYAKFTLFEMVFPKRLRKLMMNSKWQGRGNFNRGGGGDMSDPLDPGDGGE